MTGGEVDKPAIEVLHLDARLLEVRDEQADLARDRFHGVLRLLDAGRIETSTVSGHLAAKLRETLPVGDEAAACSDEPLDQRRVDVERLVRLLLAEQPHAC